jgi:pyruvate,water dikinase
LNEAHRFKPGDVLVTRTTMPPWTPLFAVASAVVTETGGILSHAAVTAREYGLPAVLCVENATRSIQDGQPLEVDGSNGIVRILN